MVLAPTIQTHSSPRLALLVASLLLVGSLVVLLALPPVAYSAPSTPTVNTLLSSPTITVGRSVTDSATLTGATGNAGGTVTYEYFSGGVCGGTPTIVGSPVTVTNAVVPNSTLHQFNSAGSYSWKGVYSGDVNNTAATSGCEPLTVNKASPSATTLLSSTTITVGGSVTDSAKLTNATSDAGGTVTYEYFSGISCAGAATVVGSQATVTNGAVPNSASQQFGSAGSYSFNAVYSGDLNNNGATSGCEPLTVNLAGVTITTNLSFSVITVGGSLIDSVSLSGTTNNAGGTVTYRYYSGGTCSGAATNVGSPVTVTNGVVPNSVSQQFSTAGSYNWFAVYSGDSNNNGATSGCEPLTVNWASPTITPTLSSTAIARGQSVSDAAILTGSFNAGGTVTYEYFAGNTCTGTATVVGSPVVVANSVVPNSASQFFVTLGLYSWNVVYSGDLNNNGATSQCQSLVVNSVGVSISTFLSATNIPFGSSVTDSATLTGATTTAGGSVTYEYFSGSYCSGAASTVGSPATVTNGVVSNSAPQVLNAAGSYSFNAVYSGDLNNNGATSGCEPLTVIGLAATTLTLSCSPTSESIGTAATCKATVHSSGSTPTGTVTWSTGSSGTFSSSTCRLSSYWFYSIVHHGFYSTCSVKFTPTAPGSPAALVANYGGDSQNSISTGTYNLGVKIRTTTTTVSCAPRSAVAGSTTVITCVVKVKGYSVTGIVTWSQSGVGFVLLSQSTCTISTGSCSVTLTGVTTGTVTLNAAYGGDSNNQGSSRTTKISVGKAATVTMVSCTPSSLGLGSVVTCTATVSGIYSSHTGTVTWSKVSGSGRIVFSSMTCLLSSGSCPVTITTTAAGSVKIKAAYGGDSNNLKSSGTLAIKASPTVTPILSSTVIAVGQSVSDAAILTGSFNAVGTGTYEYFSGNTCTGTATIVGFPVAVTGGVVPSSASQQFNVVGSYSWNVVYSGDLNNNGATSQCQSLVVNSVGVSISTLLSATIVPFGSSVADSATLSGATVNAGGTVTYEYFSGSFCSGAASTVGSPVGVTNGAVPSSLSQSFNAAGSYSFNAVYSGDFYNNGATSGCEPLNVGKATPSIATLLSSTTVIIGGSVTDSATLSGATNNAGGTVTYRYYTGGTCSGAATNVGSPVTVTNGVVPNSVSQQFSTAGSYSFNAVYSGDLNNNGATSGCEPLSV